MTVAWDERRGGALRILVLADDLIWATRLEGQLRTVGADPIRVRSVAAFAAPLAGAAPPAPSDGRPAGAVVDLTARAYDGIAAVRLAVAAGLRVMCVGQHDDPSSRRAAQDAGAERVFTYRTLFEDGHAKLAAWLGVPAPAPGSLTAPASAPRPTAGAIVPQPSSEVPAR